MKFPGTFFSPSLKKADSICPFLLLFLYLPKEKQSIEMILKHISILNYKNLMETELELSPKINCFLGTNGMGKTNLLDAIFYLSFCKSATNPIDSQNIMHGQDFFAIQGYYENNDGTPEEIYCGLKRHQKKHFKRNKKEYTRLADHIGLIPLVMVSPSDSELINGGSEERRKLMDVTLSQYDKEYLNALLRYNRALQQRNNLLKAETEPDNELFDIWEEMMATNGETLYNKRAAFIQNFIPTFQSFYAFISQGKEQVSLCYKSHAQQGGELAGLLRDNRLRDRIIGFSTKGVHKDDLEMQLEGYPLKREGSQGQSKTYLIALKLAQFDFLKKTGGNTPLLLLDDIFDKLDASRVEQIIRLVGSDNFGQIFMTDTNREHLEDMLPEINKQYRSFHVQNGTITPAIP